MGHSEGIHLGHNNYRQGIPRPTTTVVAGVLAVLILAFAAFVPEATLAKLG